MNIGFKLPNKVDAESPERTFDPRQYLNFVWRNWVFIASVTAFVFLMGVIHLVRAAPLYTATTQVLLQADKSPAPSENVSADYYRIDSSITHNQLAIVRADTVRKRVVIKEQLAAPAAKPQGTDEDEYNSDENQPIRDAINILRGALDVSRASKG